MSTPHVVWIPGRVTSLNDIIALRASWRGAYSARKREFAKDAVPLLRAVPSMRRASVMIHVVEPNTRRDPDNVCAGACKFVCDALQDAGVIKNDGWKEIAGIAFAWSVNPDDPGMWVSLREESSDE